MVSASRAGQVQLEPAIWPQSGEEGRGPGCTGGSGVCRRARLGRGAPRGWEGLEPASRRLQGALSLELLASGQFNVCV